MKEICCLNIQFKLARDNYIPLKFYHDNLVAKKAEKIVDMESVQYLEDFCRYSKLKQET
jgi:hypothetical protein